LIFNYTESAQYDRVWNAATNLCRGLIVAVPPTGLDDAEIVARPFGKFHNLNTEYVPETLEANLPTDALPLVTKKLDGSMGIVYFWDNQWWVATRGSFDSEQARWATRWFRDNVGDWIMAEDDATPVFEVIYSTNRIVVDYDFEGMVLLGVVDNYFGKELSREQVEWIAGDNKIKVVEKFSKSLAECAAENTPNEEGYVLTYSNGVKVKVKFAEYVRLHRVLTGLNPRAIWEMLSQGGGQSVDAILNDPKMPVTFLAWFTGWVIQLRAKYALIESETQAVFAARPQEASRKDTAMYFKQTPHLASVLFAMLDGKDHASIIWDRIEPKGNATFKKDGE
jgi:RNA ligase